MVNSGIITFESFGMGYQTDMDDLMLANPKNYKNAGQAYKNSKVCLCILLVSLVIVQSHLTRIKLYRIIINCYKLRKNIEKLLLLLLASMIDFIKFS